jgi:hypothetical protein
MPDKWDPDVYRQRAEAWRQRASELEGEEKAASLSIADGYKRLAALIEERASLVRPAKEA